METLIANPETILTSAIEVGIGVVGFGAIVVALLGKNEVGRILLATLLRASIAVVMFSFLPLLLVNIGLIDDKLWMTCSSVYLIYFIAVLTLRFRESASSSGQGKAQLQRNLFALFFGSIVGLLQIANVVYFHSAWPYLTMIVSTVFIAVGTFANILSMVWRKADDT